MRRVAIATAKAVVSANAARRTFHSLRTVVPNFRKQQLPTFRLSSTLTECLTNELNDELANENEEIDQDLIDVQKQVLKVFKLKEELGCSTVSLSRKHGDELIEIEFDVQDVEDNSENVDDEEEQDEEAMASGMGINFLVKITKGGNTMTVNAFASDALTIQNIRYIDAKHASVDERTLYEGPTFDELDENVQAAFYEYLTERNVDDDLSFFVLAYSRDKEQREYVNWLEKMQNFTADK